MIGSSGELALERPNDSGAREEVTKRADTVWTRGEARSRSIAARRQELKGVNGRVAIVAGVRTPFVKAQTALQDMDVVDLAGIVTAELVARSGLDPESIDSCVFGTVIPALHAPNLGREAVFRAGLPETIPGSGVSMACASSNLAIARAAESVLAGSNSAVIAGGAESLSTVPIQFTRAAAKKLMRLNKARTTGQKLAVVKDLRPSDLTPVAPAIAEYTTGLTMGQSGEKMAQENEVSRRAQDEIALMSHQRAAAAIEEGLFDEYIVSVFPQPRYSQAVARDSGVRDDSSMAALAQLKPVFDRRYGTLTAGNSSPITDGAAAVLMMAEDHARALGIEPLGYVRSYAWAALDPATQLLQGPAYAAPVALDRAGLTLPDLDLIDMHEAFAAQILSNMKAFASPKFARDELGRASPLGEVDFDRCNVNGGSISIGHPFGATGARVTMQLLYELRRRDLDLGMLTVCAAGGVGFAMVVERE